MTNDIARGWTILLNDWQRRHCWLVLRRHTPGRRWEGDWHGWTECSTCGRRYVTHYNHVPRA